MAKSEELAPFILSAEGGYVKSKTDAGGETNKGITYTVWASVFGDSPESHARFMAMQPADWIKIFKQNFWDHCLGDQINSQRVGNVIADWVWGSGQYFPEKHIQHVLNEILAKHIQQHVAEDGAFGPATIAVLNAQDEEELYNDILADREQYTLNLCQADLAALKIKYPEVTDLILLANLATKEEMKYLPNLKGWQNRIDHLKTYNLKYKTA